MPRGAKPKVYPPEMVARVRDLYAGGSTQLEVAIALGSTQKVIFNLMRRHDIGARIAAKREQRGPANSTWKGAAAGKSAQHRRLYALYGKPTQCSRCGTATAKQYDYANLSGRYDDLSDYAPMCRSCHWKYDDKIQNIRRAGGSHA